MTLEAKNLGKFSIDSGKHGLRSNDTPALWRDLTFSVTKGERLCISGPSGIGKSVLLKTLAHLEPLDEGGVYLEELNGVCITPCSLLRPVEAKNWKVIGAPDWRSKVSYVSQQPPRVAGTPGEYYRTIKGFGSQRGKQERDPCGILNSWGLGEEHWNREWGSLSGGEAQRCALVIALLLDPEVLLLDEPTSALDPASTKLVEETIIHSGIACVWVTHDAEQAKRVATKHLILGDSLN